MNPISSLLHVRNKAPQMPEEQERSKTYGVERLCGSFRIRRDKGCQAETWYGAMCPLPDALGLSATVAAERRREANGAELLFCPEERRSRQKHSLQLLAVLGSRGTAGGCTRYPREKPKPQPQKHQTPCSRQPRRGLGHSPQLSLRRKALARRWLR